MPASRAAAWLPSYADLPAHPKTRRLARVLGVTVPAAVGHLHMVWWFALTYAPDGDLSGFDDSDIAEAAMWPIDDAQAFAHALVDSGFIDGDGHVHDWDEYVSPHLARRARNAERMRATRAEHVPNTDHARAQHVHSTERAHAEHVPDTCGVRGEERRREEKRREEKREEETDEAAAAGDLRIGGDADHGFVERMETLLMHFSRQSREDRSLLQQLSEYAEEFTSAEIAQALGIHRIRNPGKPPWPSLLRPIFRELIEQEEVK